MIAAIPAAKAPKAAAARRVVAAVNAAALGQAKPADLALLLPLSARALLRARLVFLASLPPDTTAIVPSRRLILALYLHLHDRD